MRQASEAQEEKGQQRLKKGEKMRNASAQQGENE